MGKYKSLLLATILGIAVSFVVHLIGTNISHLLRARRMGCKAAFVRPYRLPLGLDILKRYADVTRDQVLQNDDLLLYEELGNRPTWSQNILGSWHHVTVDPKNVQAMLATQFKDFELGPLRRGTFGPVIGSGIFTHDGKQWYALTAIP
jgi:hypothetical protein